MVFVIIMRSCSPIEGSAYEGTMHINNLFTMPLHFISSACLCEEGLQYIDLEAEVLVS